MKKLKKVSERLGEGTAIILINARASIEAGVAKSTAENDGDDNDWISSTFVPIFHYAPPLLDKSEMISERDLLLYHEYGGPWYLAEKEKTDEKGGLLGSIGGMLGGAGSFKTLWEGKNRPSAREMKEILSGVGIITSTSGSIRQ